MVRQVLGTQVPLLDELLEELLDDPPAELVELVVTITEPPVPPSPPPVEELDVLPLLLLLVLPVLGPLPPVNRSPSSTPQAAIANVVRAEAIPRAIIFCRLMRILLLARVFIEWDY
jgi:hypothetical protein